MKNCLVICFSICLMFIVACSCNSKKDIELMGAGDRIHDSFTFANTGVEIKETDDNVYLISGSVEKLTSEEIKNEFNIASDIDYVVAIKLSANGKEVIKDKVTISVDGLRSYDAEHLNGNDYTFIILEAKKNETVSIKVSWNGTDEKSYVLKFDENLTLK